MGTSTTNTKQITMMVYTTSTTAASSTFEVFDSNDVARYGNSGATATTTSAFIWQEVYFFPSGGTFTADTDITFRIRMYANTTTDYIRISNIRFGYRAQY